MVRVEGGEQVLGEAVDQFGFMVGGQGNTEARGAFGDGGWADRLYVPATLKEGVCDGEGALVAADNDGNNW